jgi:hypothetical protein
MEAILIMSAICEAPETLGQDLNMPVVGKNIKFKHIFIIIN